MSVQTLDDVFSYVATEMQAVGVAYNVFLGRIIDKHILELGLDKNYLDGGKGTREKAGILVYGLFTDFAPLPEDLTQILASASAIHTASLCHDDVQDKAKRRRGAEAAHVTLGGDDAGVFLGDSLLTAGNYKIWEMLREQTSAARYSINPSFFVETGYRLSEAQAYLSAGQTAERVIREELRRRKNRALPTPQEITELSNRVQSIAYNKTASLIEAIAYIAALRARKSPEVAEKVRLIAQRIAYDFQRRDDVLDCIGDPLLTGKPQGSDIRNGIVNSVHIEALREGNAPSEEREILYQTFCMKRAPLKRVVQANQIGATRGVPVVQRSLEEKIVGIQASIMELEAHAIGKEAFCYFAQKLVNREK
ncbi:MAG TPA: polyprenyl synthetase family protein [Candidatus Nanoarchaeia archaeon]|nr:polyprenyl synthetase family protein [Candidatus Nanoarchaeia archaeon]